MFLKLLELGSSSFSRVDKKIMLSLVVSSLAVQLPARLPSRHGAVSMAAGSAPLKFSKYHGLGNDFALVDCREAGVPAVTPEQAAQMCDRNFGVGADGVIFVLPPDVPGAQYRMRIYNSDGSEPEMCGNGWTQRDSNPQPSELE